jgi:hypothetical protein
VCSDDDDPYEDVRNRGDEEDGYREKGVDQELKQMEEEAEEEEEEAKEAEGKNAEDEADDGEQEGNSKQGKLADKGRGEYTIWSKKAVGADYVKTRSGVVL